MVTTIDGIVPDPTLEKDAVKREGMECALQYMGLAPRTPIREIKLDKVFVIPQMAAAAAIAGHFADVREIV